MKQTTTDRHDSEMLDEYDFTDGVKGKYVQRYYESTNLVRLDEDVVKMFPDAKSVNEALRALGKLIVQHQQKAR